MSGYEKDSPGHPEWAADYWDHPCCGKYVGVGTGPVSVAAGGIAVYCLLSPGHSGLCDPYIHNPETKEITMLVTAKFIVSSRTPFGTEADPATVIGMFPDYADERNKAWAWAWATPAGSINRNKAWAWATPAGSINLTIRNAAQAADFFEIGKPLLVTFEADPEAL